MAQHHVAYKKNECNVPKAINNLKPLWNYHFPTYDGNSFLNISGNYCKLFVDKVASGDIVIPASCNPALYGVCKSFKELRHACFGLQRQSGESTLSLHVAYMEDVWMSIRAFVG